MSKNIEVRSRQNAKLFKSDKPWIAISISTESGDFPELSTENRVGLLRLRFWDIANPSSRQIQAEDSKLFSVEQAKEVLDFVNANWDKVDAILVHCEAGMSRSPAIAAAIEYIKNGKEASMPYFKKYIPNGFVYKTLLEVCYGYGTDASRDANRIVSDAAYNQIEEEPWDCTK